VRNEIRSAKKGKDAYIHVKLNNIADPEIIGLLYEAADAGVKVKLNVRGMYSVLPSAIEHPENLEAIGIVDRFLEHSRILVFANGGNEKMFLSSADWMTRNLDRRVEVTFPIYDPALHKDLKEVLELQWADNVKARILDEPLSNQYRPRKGEAVRSQSAFYELVKKRTLGEELKESKPQATA
jgi:polyphosphate kinase